MAAWIDKQKTQVLSRTRWSSVNQSQPLMHFSEEELRTPSWQLQFAVDLGVPRLD